LSSLLCGIGCRAPYRFAPETSSMPKRCTASKSLTTISRSPTPQARGPPLELNVAVHNQIVVNVDNEIPTGVSLNAKATCGFYFFAIVGQLAINALDQRVL
jgi:hypothetical protein